MTDSVLIPSHLIPRMPKGLDPFTEAELTRVKSWSKFHEFDLESIIRDGITFDEVIEQISIHKGFVSETAEYNQIRVFYEEKRVRIEVGFWAEESSYDILVRLKALIAERERVRRRNLENEAQRDAIRLVQILIEQNSIQTQLDLLGILARKLGYEVVQNQSDD